jgi:hypothetical protein
MDVNGALISIDPKAKGVLFEPKDWDLVEGFNMMRHKPTSCLFQIECDDAAMRASRTTIFDFSARLIHVCGDGRIPRQAEQARLGRAAIALFLQEIGVWKPEVINIPDRRSPRQGERRAG